jgi:hypothetical protein
VKGPRCAGQIATFFKYWLTDDSQITAGVADSREQIEFATELVDEWTGEQPLWERLRGPNQVRSRQGY